MYAVARAGEEYAVGQDELRKQTHAESYRESQPLEPSLAALGRGTVKTVVWREKLPEVYMTIYMHVMKGCLVPTENILSLLFYAIVSVHLAL